MVMGRARARTWPGTELPPAPLPRPTPGSPEKGRSQS